LDLKGGRSSIEKQLKLNGHKNPNNLRELLRLNNSYACSLFVDNEGDVILGSFGAIYSGFGNLFRFVYVLFERSGLLGHFAPLPLHPTALPFHFHRLYANHTKSPTEQRYLKCADSHQEQIESPCPPICPVPSSSVYRHGGELADNYGIPIIFGMLFSAIALGWPIAVCFYRGWRWQGFCLIGCTLVLDVGGCLSGIIGCLPWDWWRCLHDGQEHSQRECFHGNKLYHKKSLTDHTFCNTFSDMANVLNTDKQIAVIGALAEGSSIRSIERITGVHRDTIMRLGVKIGQGCVTLLDAKMRDLPCRRLELDEIWGFIGKKERHLRPDDDPQYGDVWTFCAIDADTKLVPSFKCGKRDLATAKAFVGDVASRMANRVQISADALRAYQDAIEQTFGDDVDFAQIIKTYEHDESQHPGRKYSAPEFVSVEKRAVTGSPDMDLVSTSYVERLNATTRLQMRRLTRLTLAFSKKLENFEAAVALHFAYYNLVKRHGTLRCTPAMAAGIERDFWSVGDLVEATA